VELCLALPGWDMGLDYELAYRKLLRLLRRNGKERCYAAIGLTQLRNGLRAVEAVWAFKHFLKTKQLEFTIAVAKKKKPEERLVVMPKELALADLASCIDLLEVEDRKLRDRYRWWLRNKLGWNTHSLRYAFITHLLRNGVNPSIVAKITKHSRLDYILTYTQEKAAEQILRNL
jgi:integrase